MGFRPPLDADECLVALGERRGGLRRSRAARTTNHAASSGRRSPTSPSLRAFGCPLGAVCAELGKHSAELGAAAGNVFSALIDWAAGEFAELGFAEAAARARATHVIAVMQGAASLSNALDDSEPLEREAAHLERWIRRAGE